jgi:hypothetical protein
VSRYGSAAGSPWTSWWAAGRGPTAIIGCRRTADQGWLTHWALGEQVWRLDVVFLERAAHHSGALVIRPGDPIGIPGRYPMPPGYLDPNRYAILEGVTFRVGSPSGEWLARADGARVVAGRPPDPKIEHDRRLLEGLLAPAELAALRAAAAGGPAVDG